MRIDLHTHSSVSDGTDTPTRLVLKAMEEGLDVIALTDHDVPAADELIALYSSVGWSAYTRDPVLLHDAVARSLRLASRRSTTRWGSWRSAR